MVARYDLSYLHWQVVPEHRPCIHERVEFPVLATRIDFWRQFGEQLFSNSLPTNSGGRHLQSTQVSLARTPEIDHGTGKPVVVILLCFRQAQTFQAPPAPV